MTMNMPQIVSKVFPTAYVTVYPRPGTWLPADRLIIPSERRRRSRARRKGAENDCGMEAKDVLREVHAEDQRHGRRDDAPEEQTEAELLKPATNFGPAVMPMTAMNMLSPTEFMNHSVADGMRPKVGRIARYQPKTMPKISAPPAVESVIGIRTDLQDDRADQRADGDRNADEGNVGDVGWHDR